MKLKTALTSAALAVSMAALSVPAMARDTISIVGSSTVYPFATVVAERFGTSSDFPTPRMESTGSGGGLKIFCQGVGTQHPDITNSSRRIKASEFELCASNGVNNIGEFRIGFDGIVVASSKDAEALNLSLEQLFLALGEKVPVDGKWVMNPYKNWSDIDSSLPNKPILVMGPPPTSGTRDSFNEMAMQGGCEGLPEAKAMEKSAMEATCQSIREDGVYIEAGENDNLIVQRLVSDKAIYGVFGYSFLEENADRLQAAELNGVAPTQDNISEDKYPIARSMYFYVKNDHVGVVPGIKEYVAEFVSPTAMGPNGYLKDVGLIVPQRDELMKLNEKAEKMPNLQISDLK